VIDRASSVFINCPFDEDYRSQFNAMVFTCVYAGFSPEHADSSGRSGRPRVERILEGLRSCPYSVHDLWRCRGEGSDNLARFNMPLELGMAMAIRGAGAAEGAHEFLVLVPDDSHAYHRYISDLGGFDPGRHDGSPARIASEVLAWLLAASEARDEIAPEDVIAKLPAFDAARADLDRAWQEGTVPWGRIVLAAERIARDHAH
jgi:hypothetical protein